MTSIKSFYDAVPWEFLVPIQGAEWLTAAEASEQRPPLDDASPPSEPLVKALLERGRRVTCVVAYFAPGSSTQLTIHRVKHGHYTVEWFEPSSGTYVTPKDPLIVDPSGDLVLPRPPSRDEWLVRVRPRGERRVAPRPQLSRRVGRPSARPARPARALSSR